ncbi:hypothetical protein [uncultured Alteromonas sp.]|jgi:hypothetical protein|uniref:hypothetical protein n=1 Tax=uncultured Alteromonas sp. TaxID=179113 RepID=UPI0030D521F9|tara:strand:+ start:18017 stop:18253 length:237 start_codon:yes stop_codon:yes gene_type:complete
MAIVYISDKAATHQAKQWEEHRANVNPLFLCLAILLSTLYATAIIDFKVLTYFAGFIAFVKIFCNLKIKEFKSPKKAG